MILGTFISVNMEQFPNMCKKCAKSKKKLARNKHCVNW